MTEGMSGALGAGAAAAGAHGAALGLGALCRAARLGNDIAATCRAQRVWPWSCRTAAAERDRSPRSARPAAVSTDRAGRIPDRARPVQPDTVGRVAPASQIIFALHSTTILHCISRRPKATVAQASAEMCRMERLALMRALSFGAQVAEEETAELATYFVETDQWLRIFNGEVDIVRGPKGAGKSAIYSLLTAKADELFDKKILLVTAEKPRGTPVFKELEADPPTTENQFIALWKLYISTLIAQELQEFGISGSSASELNRRLAEQGLLEAGFDITKIFRVVKDYASRWLNPQAIEAELKFEPSSGVPTGIAGKITPSEPTSELRAKGYASVDTLSTLANQALESAGYKVWVLLDRLDVAFAETHDLERNALRALFRVYLDFLQHDHIKLKIFLRSDIWTRIVEGGFREASHITRVAALEWKPDNLLNLVIKRLLKNDVLIEQYKIDRASVLKDFSAQTTTFYRMFPPQVEQGSRKPKTWDWMVTRCADATDTTAPREMIHLLISLRQEEISRLERGESAPPDEQLFDRSIFKTALPAVSEARLIQNLYAEYPELKQMIMKLTGQKTEQTLESLEGLWGVNEGQAEKIADSLIEVGFFEVRESQDRSTTYWVPFLFRDALKMIQGLAED